ncbi:hypothetical protein OAF45_00230 [Candidatus Latescibacteria bacterium]|jgi:hypothetical protein|nr:hypothetical protein [Candidatus Latescibacterota bacterium]
MNRATVILFALSLVAIGCADEDNPATSVSSDNRIVGSWADKDGTTYLFQDDGVFVDEFGDRYRWTTDNGKLVIRGGDEYYGTYSYQITEDTLTLTDPDNDFKVGDPAIFSRTE